MVPLTSLAAPIALSAVIVFIASSVIHMALKYHSNDFKKLPDEDAALEAFRKLGVSPGDYAAPHAGSMEAMKSPAFVEKMAKGPIVTMTVSAGGPLNMASSLTYWFVYSVVISLFAAYVTGRMLPEGANYLTVFRVAGTTAFMGYAMALPQQSIWFKKSWGTTLTSMMDGLIYALLTGGTFGWLWP
ncbi:MAG: hypothetical protein HQ485_05815 [Acidobacteria bacterium]|jgi:hypothetical protein|nr:hypothetical protein [Acidobacteriota bacterium]